RNKTKTLGRNTHRQNQNAQNVGCVGFADARWRSSCRRAIIIHWRRNRSAVGYPPYVCRHVLAFSSNFFGAITHLGGRDIRVPVRCRFAANLCGITRGKPTSLTVVLLEKLGGNEVLVCW
ncbi:MAG: hypothetical protein LBQ66_06580, partial [Planctomycetaceae bacterium]|nr:hypothetical protein [Planctomycetaceae bacterium]